MIDCELSYTFWQTTALIAVQSESSSAGAGEGELGGCALLLTCCRAFSRTFDQLWPTIKQHAKIVRNVLDVV